jgi:hypothetical protein
MLAVTAADGQIAGDPVTDLDPLGAGPDSDDLPAGSWPGTMRPFPAVSPPTMAELPV